jgi:hypothetical protein
MDPDARLVNQKVVVPTTIAHLRSLPAPASLPARSRLHPVETTVWAVDAILLRYKLEIDSDVHLVRHGRSTALRRRSGAAGWLAGPGT